MADVTIFNPATVIDRATYLEPFQFSTGILHVIVNGQSVLEDSRHTRAHPGRAFAIIAEDNRTRRFKRQA